jgi:anaerobic magnesium-protoporphyrin IX monomethyl ester cyclase
MRYKNILLVNPFYKNARVRVVFSAGLGYIAENLKVAGFEYDVLDMSLGYSYRHLKQKINRCKPDLVGISMMTHRYKNTYALIKTIKKDFPGIDIVVGGPHISLFREEVLKDCPQIDFGVVLEGEESIVQLCQGNQINSISGLIFRREGKIIYNGDRSVIKNLDEIPFPRYEKFELNKSINKNINALPIVSSRGCPGACSYCPVKRSIGTTFRTRTPQNIISELNYWYQIGYRRFSFADDNFTLIRERVYGLCQLIKERKFQNLKLSCDNGIRADTVDKDLLLLMKEAGFYRIAFGVEAGNNKILKYLNKQEDIEIIKKSIADACALGFEVDLFFLVGSPGETKDDLEDSFRIALTYPIKTAYFYNIIPFPETELFKWILKNGKFLKQPKEYLNRYPILDNEPVFQTPQLSGQERKKQLKRAFGVMHLTMRNAWANKLSNLGILGKVLAFIYASKFMQGTVIKNRFARKLVYKLGSVFLYALK